MVFSFLASLPFYGLHSQDGAPIIPANPLDHLSPSLRLLVQTAAANSWRMNVQDILVKQAEALSMRYTSVKNTKVSLNMNTGYQVQETAINASDGWKYRFDVVARKPLYTWGAAEADHQFGLLQVKRVKQNRQLAFLIIYRDVVFRFIEYQIIQQRAVASALSEEITREYVDLRRGEVERGEFPATQFAAIELNHKRELLSHKAILNSLAKAQDNFREQIGLEEGSELILGQGLPPVATDLEMIEARIQQFQSMLDQSSLKVMTQQARLDQTNERLKKYVVNQKPKVNGVLRLRHDSENIITGDRRNLEFTEGFAGFEFSWNIYDGKNTHAFIIDSLESRRQLEREIEILKDNIKDDLGFYLADLRIELEQSKLSDQTFSWEEGRFRQMAEDVDEGRSPEKELQAAKRDLEKVRSTQYQARGDYFKSLTNLYVMLEFSSILAYLEE